MSDSDGELSAADQRKRKRQWLESRGIDPSEFESGADASTESLEDDARAEIETLAQAYTIEEVTDPEFVENELSSVRYRVNALADRTPEHAARLADRAAALEAVSESAIGTRDTELMQWSDLEALAFRE